MKNIVDLVGTQDLWVLKERVLPPLPKSVTSIIQIEIVKGKTGTHLAVSALHSLLTQNRQLKNTTSEAATFDSWF